MYGLPALFLRHISIKTKGKRLGEPIPREEDVMSVLEEEFCNGKWKNDNQKMTCKKKLGGLEGFERGVEEAVRYLQSPQIQEPGDLKGIVDYVINKANKRANKGMVAQLE